MAFQAVQMRRSGVIRCRGAMGEVFPLLCPKREEEWIPGWECETIWSKSGYNEAGAIFRTSKPYGTELYWTTLRYDGDAGVVDFLITAPRRFVFRFTIDVTAKDAGAVEMEFTQVFTGVSAEGNALIERYRGEDFGGRLGQLEKLMNEHVAAKRGGR